MLYGLLTSLTVTKNKFYISVTMKTVSRRGVAQNILNKQSRTVDKEWPTSWEVRHEIDVPVCGEQRNRVYRHIIQYYYRNTYKAVQTRELRATYNVTL
jgi:hypothetical protein